jgi:hypothetical protein
MVRTRAGLLALAVGLLTACTTYHDDLARGQQAFEQNNYERALALFRVLEPDVDHLTGQERGAYAYLRGMSDFRIGYRADARHWLIVAKALDAATPGTLTGDWRDRMNEALTELNDQVYAGETLTNARKPRGEEPTPKKKAKSEDEP